MGPRARIVNRQPSILRSITALMTTTKDEGWSLQLVLAPNWRYSSATMPSVQVKGVPDDVHRVLRARAAKAGQSLQEYLLARLVDAAREEPLDEVLARAGGRSGGTVDFAFALDSLREDRDAR